MNSVTNPASFFVAALDWSVPHCKAIIYLTHMLYVVVEAVQSPSRRLPVACSTSYNKAVDRVAVDLLASRLGKRATRGTRATAAH
jgi:hypothetical protein